MDYHKNFQTLFMILGSHAPENEKDLDTQKKTWLATLPSDQKYLIIRGSEGDSTLLQGDTLTLPVVEKYENILEKTLLGFQWALENTDFKFLIRTNVSTYFPVQIVEKEIRSIDSKSHFYGGFIDECWNLKTSSIKKISFVTGSAIVMTRPTVQLLCKLSWDDLSGLPDDVAISCALNHANIEAQLLKRNNLGSSHLFYPKFQIRTKTSSVSHLASERMGNIHKYFQTSSLVKKIFFYLIITKNEIRYATLNLDEFFTFVKFCLYSLKKSVTRVFG